MFDYTTPEGFEYARVLLRDYLGSDFFENPDNLEELVLNEQQLKELFNTRLFKQFLIQRENDYTTLASFLAEASYQYEEGFGSLLDLNPGKYEVLSAFDEFKSTEPVVVTKFTDPVFFDEESTVLYGDTSLMTMIGKEGKTFHPILRVKGRLYGEEDFDKASFDDFDTIIYLHEPELMTLISLLRYSIEHNKKFVTGVVSNVFDTHCSEKFEKIDEIFKRVESKVGPDTITTEKILTCGSAIKLIHTL